MMDGINDVLVESSSAGQGIVGNVLELVVAMLFILDFWQSLAQSPVPHALKSLLHILYDRSFNPRDRIAPADHLVRYADASSEGYPHVDNERSAVIAEVP